MPSTAMDPDLRQEHGYPFSLVIRQALEKCLICQWFILTQSGPRPKNFSKRDEAFLPPRQQPRILRHRILERFDRIPRRFIDQVLDQLGKQHRLGGRFPEEEAI